MIASGIAKVLKYHVNRPQDMNPYYLKSFTNEEKEGVNLEIEI